MYTGVCLAKAGIDLLEDVWHLFQHDSNVRRADDQRSACWPLALPLPESCAQVGLKAMGRSKEKQTGKSQYADLYVMISNNWCERCSISVELPAEFSWLENQK